MWMTLFLPVAAVAAVNKGKKKKPKKKKRKTPISDKLFFGPIHPPIQARNLSGPMVCSAGAGAGAGARRPVPLSVVDTD